MRTSTKERKPMSYREGSEKSGKMRDADVEIEIKTGSKKKGPEGEMEEPEKEGPEEEEMDSSAGRRPRGSRKRSAKGAKHTKAPMDGEGSCGCGKKGKVCSCGKVMKDAGCGMKKRSDVLTPQEYLAACELGIQGRSRAYIRARLDSANLRQDKKCGASGIADNKKCSKGGVGGNIIAGATLVAGAGLAGAAAYQHNQRKTKEGQQVVKKLHTLRHKANSGVRAVALAAKNAVEFARESKKIPEETAVQQGMQAVKEAKERRTATYAEARKTISELGSVVPKSPARRRRASRKSDSVYADGFNFDLTSVSI